MVAFSLTVFVHSMSFTVYGGRKGERIRGSARGAGCQRGNRGVDSNLWARWSHAQHGYVTETEREKACVWRNVSLRAQANVHAQIYGLCAFLSFYPRASPNRSHQHAYTHVRVVPLPRFYAALEWGLWEWKALRMPFFFSVKRRSFALSGRERG